MAQNKNFSKTSTDILIANAKAIAPSYDATSNAPAEPGSVVHITGAGTEAAGLYQYDGSAWVGPVNNSITDFEALDDVSSGTLANRPAAGTAGNWYFTTDNAGVFYDDGTAWQLVAEHPANIGAADLGFDPATQTELNTHAGTAGAHHARPTTEEMQDAAGTMATDGVSYDDTNNALRLNIIKSGTATLASGTVSIDTGIASTTTATFFVAIGPDTDDAEITTAITAVSAGNYTVDIEETSETAVGNPTVNFDIIRIQ